MPYGQAQRHHAVPANEILLVAGGCFFALISGFVNLVFLEAARVTLSHMTGNVAHLSDALYRGFELSVWHFLLILFAFVAGAMLSGFVVGDGAFAPGRRYGYLILLEASLLLVVCFLFEGAMWTAVGVASLAMGLQNAMASSYHGLVIRTTHMTGILTDLGFLLGAALKRRKILFWKFWFFLLVLAGFFVGGWAGMTCYFKWGIRCLLIPSVLLSFTGLIYLAYVTRTRRTAA